MIYITPTKVSFKIFTLCSFLFVFISLFFSFSCYAQSNYVADPAIAKDYMSKRNYPAAIKVYLMLLKKEPENVEYNQNIAKCYLLGNTIKEKAIPHLEFLIKQGKHPNDVWLDLGKGYQYAKKMDDAINAYNQYKATQSEKKEIELVERYIEQCRNGIELIKHPLNITFQNMGKAINSEFPDYYPIISPDESTLYFTSRRKGGAAARAEFDGLYPSDIYIAQVKDGKLAKAIPIGSPINTALDEQVVDVSEDGTIMLFYIDHIEVFGDVWITRRINNKSAWLKPEPLPKVINSGMETSASIYKNPTTEEEVLLIASSRPGTTDNPNYGETDIYMSRKLPTGSWSDPKNLGANINTKYKEEFPQLSDDGKTLYFASQGHSSMGGFDLFKSVWDETSQTWSAPKNLGYPINTPLNEQNISFTSDGRIAYLSTLREGGQGDLDVYRLILNDIEAKETVYKGYVSSSDSLHKAKDVQIEITDKNTSALHGVYNPDPNTNYYVMALSPGKWTIKVTAKGFKTYIEDIVITDEVLLFSPEVTKNIVLQK